MTVADLFTSDFLFALLKIIGADLVLGIDNAVVIALACRGLPAHLKTKGIIWGTAGAILLRIMLIIGVVYLLHVPFLKVVGAALLVWIGVKLMQPDDDAHGDIEATDKLWGAVKTIIVADVVMSFDNVVAIAAAAQGAGQHSTLLVVFGIVISIPIIIFGSQIILKFMAKYPWIITVGAMLLGFIGGEMLYTDVVVQSYMPAEGYWKYVFGIVGALLVLALGKWFQSRQTPAVLH